MDLKSLKNCHRKRFSLCVFLASWSAWLWICGKVDSKNRQITMWWIETLHLESLSTFLMYHTWHFIWMERVQLAGVTQRNYTSQLTAPASMSHHLRRILLGVSTPWCSDSQCTVVTQYSRPAERRSWANVFCLGFFFPCCAAETGLLQGIALAPT